MTKLKQIPTFKTEDDERDFWATHDATDYFDFRTARRVVFPNLKPSTKTISLRLPEWLLHDLRREANRRDVPYQSFMKQALVDHLNEIQHRRSRVIA